MLLLLQTFPHVPTAVGLLGFPGSLGFLGVATIVILGKKTPIFAKVLALGVAFIGGYMLIASLDYMTYG